MLLHDILILHPSLKAIDFFISADIRRSRDNTGCDINTMSWIDIYIINCPVICASCFYITQLFWYQPWYQPEKLVSVRMAILGSKMQTRVFVGPIRRSVEESWVLKNSLNVHRKVTKNRSPNPYSTSNKLNNLSNPLWSTYGL